MVTKLRFALWGFLLAAAVTANAAPAAGDLTAGDPTTEWQFDYESGILWHFTGSASPLDYVFLPQILSLRAPANFSRNLGGGVIVLRSRYSLIAEPIIHGPEHHYYAASGSGLLEWWDHRRTRCLFFASGGGFGWLNAHGQQIAGAQGQEFNVNWFAYGGGRLHLGSRCMAGLGLYFQHVSNGHLDKIDPGVNAIGPMLNVNWRF